MPIVPHYEPACTSAERAALAALAARIMAEEPGLASVPPLAPDLDTGLLAAPSLLIEDHSDIMQAREHGVEVIYTYRGLLLAGEGDMLAIAGPRNPAFEAYGRDVLGLGEVMVLSPTPAGPGRPLSLACTEDAAFVARVAATARAGGGLNVVPYMATGGAWRLAGEIARQAGVPVRVAGPPPNLARAVNDKPWFARCAGEALGRTAVPTTATAHGIGALVGRLRRLARGHAAVGLKLPQSAASLGNLVLDSADIVAASPRRLAERLGDLLRDQGWRELFPIQVTAWEAPLVGSPSAQLWIPKKSDGPPVVEGVFDQIVQGRIGNFGGAVASRLPSGWRHRIAAEAMRLGILFQHLGYFGRCSFDAVLAGHAPRDARLHWVECNGRWGGVSIPMTLANRLTGDWSAGGLLIMNRRLATMGVSGTATFLARFADALYRPGVRPVGAILLFPGHLERGEGIDLMVLGRDDAEAEALGEALLARLAA